MSHMLDQQVQKIKIAVVTPYYRTELKWLEQCLESVKAQTHACTHIIVCDGDDSFPQALVYEGLQVIQLPVTHPDYGDTPRAIGSVSALCQGFAAVAWLDADNWYKPEHIQTLVNAHETSGAAVCTSARDLYHLDGSYLGPCPETARGEIIDTNCYLVTQAAQELVSVWWLMKPNHHIIGDRVLHTYLKKHKLPHQHLNEHTVCYRSAFKVHYDYFGVPYPAGVKDNIEATLTDLLEDTGGK